MNREPEQYGELPPLLALFDRRLTADELLG